MAQQKDLSISQLILALELSGQEIVPFAKGNANGAFTVELLMSTIREGLATQSSVNGKQNKLTPGYGIEITAENEIRTNLDVSPFVIVDELPTSDILNKIYLLPDPDGQVGKNEYVEYLWVNDHWEIVGKYTVTVDLAPYLKSADAERIYQKKADMPNMEEYAKVTALNSLALQLASITTQLSNIQTKLNSIPTMPMTDGKCYAMLNGQWEVIADINELVATVKQDAGEETPSGPN